MRSKCHSSGSTWTSTGPQDQEQKRHPGCSHGHLNIVGLGPGSSDLLSPKAKLALERSKVIVGYKTYLKLLEKKILQDKEVISTGMTKEIQRGQTALQKANSGMETALICSGDAGIYAMAGLVFELWKDMGLTEDVSIEVIPGVPALSAAAALLGAPLMHDFAAISLSDLLTSWEVIIKRIRAAATADFVLVLYNPKSKKRSRQLPEAMQNIRTYRNGKTPVGIVRNAYREGESIIITTLDDFDAKEVDMFCTVIIGNSQTRIIGNRMVTPRGYLGKYSTDTTATLI